MKNKMCVYVNYAYIDTHTCAYVCAVCVYDRCT